MTKRWVPRLRFSLRTLLLTVLLIASGATLWWNWGPWAFAYQIEEPFDIRETILSDDGQFILVFYISAVFDQDGVDDRSCLDIRYVSNGRQHAFFQSPHRQSGEVSVKGDYVLMDNNYSNPFSGAVRPSGKPHVFNWRSGAELDDKGKLNEYTFNRVLGLNTVFAGDSNEAKVTRWMRLPNFEVLRVLDFGWNSFSPDGKLIEHVRDQLHVFDPVDGREIIKLAAPSHNTTPNQNGLIGDYYYWKIDDVLSILNVRTGAGPWTKEKATLAHVCKDGKRIWLQEGEQSTALYEFGSKMVGPIVRIPSINLWFSDDERMIMDRFGTVFDGITFQEFRNYNSNFVIAFNTAHKLMIHVDGDDQVQIAEAQTHRRIMHFVSRHFTKSIGWDRHLRFSPDASLVIDGPSIKSPEEPIGRRCVDVYRLRRPWEWYGPAYLPEFWLTIVFGIGFVWSVWKDRRTV